MRVVGVVIKLMGVAMKVKKEVILKSIFSVLWNLFVYGSENKVEICVVDGFLEFFVSILIYKFSLKIIVVIENGGGVLRNIFSYIIVREDYR